MFIGVNSRMTWRSLVCGAIFLGGYGLCSGRIAGGSDQSGGADNTNPYALISERNPFRMNPPPPTPDPASLLPPPELPEVILSGTMIVAGLQKAMFAVKTKEPKDPKVKAAAGPQETTTYMCLAEGDTSGPVHLLKIKKGGDEVEIVNSGTHMTLTMKDNGFSKDTTTAARGGGPAAVIHNLPGANNPPPTMPGQPAAQPGGNGGINVGGFNTAGQNAANAGGGTLSGGFNQGRTGFSQQASSSGNSGGVVSGGYSAPASSAATTAPTGMNTLPMNFSGNLGDPRSLQPNNTPTTTTPLRGNIPMPPVPGQNPNQKE